MEEAPGGNHQRISELKGEPLLEGERHKIFVSQEKIERMYAAFGEGRPELNPGPPGSAKDFLRADDGNSSLKRGFLRPEKGLSIFPDREQGRQNMKEAFRAAKLMDRERVRQEVRKERALIKAWNELPYSQRDGHWLPPELRSTSANSEDVEVDLKLAEEECVARLEMLKEEGYGRGDPSELTSYATSSANRGGTGGGGRGGG